MTSLKSERNRTDQPVSVSESLKCRETLCFCFWLLTTVSLVSEPLSLADRDVTEPVKKIKNKTLKFSAYVKSSFGFELSVTSFSVIRILRVTEAKNKNKPGSRKLA